MVLARLLRRGMAERGGGQIVFVSSLIGKAATAGASVYSATKFGLRGFAQGLREDLRPRGVGVSIVLPGLHPRRGDVRTTPASKLPPYVGTKHARRRRATPSCGAIERDRSEVDVAPLRMRLGAAFAGLAPELSRPVQRRLGADEIAAQVEDGQRG